jgi:Leucine-rich repeat (LRR) protein
MNGIFGAIHKEITNMSHLKELYAFGNYFAGTIPKELTKLKKLEILDLYANQLSGTIPSELAKLPKLSEYFYFHFMIYHIIDYLK